MITIAIPKKIENELKFISQKFGLSRQDILMNAILYYLRILEKKNELKDELKIWETASDMDLMKFEKKI